METKTFEALTMKDAIKAVKKEFGSDAVIIRTKEKISSKHENTRYFEVVASAPIAQKTRPQSSLTGHLTNINSDEYRALENRFTSAIDTLPSKANIQTVESGLKELKMILMESLEASSSKNTRLNADERAIKNQLKIMNVSDGNISAVMKHLKEKKTELQKKGGETQEFSSDFYKEHAIRFMLKNIRIAPQWNIIKGGMSIQCFVGTPGVGKTSTIIKLATHFKTKSNSNVLVISYDNTKLGGAEQLKIYSNIIDCKFEQINEPSELESVLAKHRDVDIVLIDCSGQNAKSGDLEIDLASLTELTLPIDFHLVCSTSEKELQSEQAIRHFSPLGIQSLIFTKIDETWSFGEVYNLTHKWSIPLSYFSTGQNIPDDIEKASRERVVEQIFGL